MENIYLFIIWNKALFAREKIINDLKESFDIQTDIFVEWSRENFDKNLKAFYGFKIDNIKQKTRYIGTGKFNVILVKDDNPSFEVKTINGITQRINTKVLDKKKLYRKWTADCFRVHCSTNKEETDHDLTVLFGDNVPNQNISVDTKGVSGFKSISDLKHCLEKFGDNYFNEDNLIIAKSSLNVARFLDAKQIETGKYLIVIGGENKEIIIIGEKEGELFNLDYNSLIKNKKLHSDIERSIYEYVKYINDGVMSSNVQELFNYYKINEVIALKNSINISQQESSLIVLKNYIKYIVARLSI